MKNTDHVFASSWFSGRRGTSSIFRARGTCAGALNDLTERGSDDGGGVVGAASRETQSRRQSFQRVLVGSTGARSCDRLPWHAEEILASRVRLQQVRLISERESFAHDSVEGIEGRTTETKCRVGSLQKRMFSAFTG